MRRSSFPARVGVGLQIGETCVLGSHVKGGWSRPAKANAAPKKSVRKQKGPGRGPVLAGWDVAVDYGVTTRK